MSNQSYRRPRIGLDFDNTIYSFISGWIGPTAIEGLRELETPWDPRKGPQE